MPLTQSHLKRDKIWKIAKKRNQLVYAMRQVHNLNVAGIVKKSSDEADYLKGGGICMGISIQWLNLRKRHKNYPSKNMICNEVSLLTLRIQQSPFSSIAGTLVARGLRIIESHENKVWRKLPLLGDCLALFCSANHAMAIQIKKGVFHFFDPNYGHLKFNSRSDFQSIVDAIIIIGGRYAPPYKIYRVF